VRNAVLGSTAAHVLVVAALLVLRPAREVLVPGPDVVQVALVDATLAPTPPAPAQRSAPEAVAPAPEKGVRIVKPREKAKPHPERQEKPKAAPAQPAPVAPASAASIVLPYASVGGGMRGQVAVDESNFEFAYYLQQVRTMIARNWSPASGSPPGTHVEIYFRVSRDGSLTSPRVEVSSGNDYFDQSAVRAVIVTGHLPPLPLGYSGGDLGIHFGFEYSGS
jgi:colicin import membrane protein